MEQREAVARAIYEAQAGKPSKWLIDHPRKGIRTAVDREWDDLTDEQRAASLRQADAALDALKADR